MFAHLHTHTEFSLLDGSNKIKEYVKKVKSLGMTAAAITDHGVMYGVIDFYRECRANDINPVLGCEVYVAPGSRFDREMSHGDDKYYHLILLAENNIGYQNLMKIVSIGFVDGFYYKPRIDFETIEKYHEGLICLSACLAGEVARLLARGLYDQAKEVALKYNNTFGDNNYFLEMQDHGIPEQKLVNQQLLRLSEETGIKLVVTNDCHYTNASDASSHDVLLCIQTGKKLMDEDRMRYDGGQYYVKSEEEMLSIFPYAYEAINRTQEIADRCHVEIEFGVTKLPHFDVPEGYDSWTYLNKLCFDGLSLRYPGREDELKPRLTYELETIKNMGYVDYFLIVWDFINFARTHGIPVGPGRGSAAGALVSYTTGITNIDPMRYSLLFERFLNPERVSMPDIDIDFCYERRAEVIDYVVKKYGKDCVTQIVTFGTLKAKGVIRDVGRVMDLPYSFCDQLAKMIPDELGITLSDALKMNNDLKKLYESDDKVKELIDTAMCLEGLPRNTSMHAAGVVISQNPMWEYVPLSRGSDGTITTQFIMTTIEELGLLKMDFLGLRTLTVINDAVKLIKENRNIDINVDTIDYDDKAVFDLIASGKCEGIFQLESAGMKNFMKELKPESLEDVIAGISLYRPGPMDFIPAYIRGKSDRESIVYDCPQMEPILKPTYGCIVYQEQVMQIVRDLAGYSMGRSDLVRRAMSKKKHHVMEEERKNFVYGNEDAGVPGCLKNGIEEAVANKIFDDMIAFASYAFNKSHAAAYAVVAYQTAYLKYYYPVEFMAALLTSVIDAGATKIAQYINVCKSMGIQVLPPDVNYGAGRFAVDNGNIRYGMYAIKSVGRPTIDAIFANRSENGEFTSIEDFINRINGHEVNKRTIENLIKAGAFDSIEGNRRQKCLVFPGILDSVNASKKNDIEGQMSLFDFVDDADKQKLSYTLPDVEEFDKSLILEFEKELMGVYVSGHPLDEYTTLMNKTVTATSADFVYDEETGKVPIDDNKEVILGGLITANNEKYTKTGKSMTFLTVEDMVGSVEVIVFSREYEKYKNLINNSTKIFIKGHASVEEEKDAKLIASDFVSMTAGAKQLWIQFATMEEYEANQQKLIELIAPMDGDSSVMVYIAEGKLVKNLGQAFSVEINQANLQMLYDAFCEKNVKVVEKNIDFNHKRG